MSRIPGALGWTARFADSNAAITGTEPMLGGDRSL